MTNPRGQSDPAYLSLVIGHLSLGIWSRKRLPTADCPHRLVGGVGAEDSEVKGHLPKMPQRVRARAVADVALEVQIKEILPGFAVDWPRFNLGQVDIAQGKDRQRLEERAGLVLQAEDHRGLAASLRILASKSHRKETRIVLPVVLDAPAQDLHFVDARGVGRGNRRNCAQSLLADVLHAPRRVIEGNLLYTAHFPQEFLALGQSYGMRVNLPDGGQQGVRVGNQMMLDANVGLPYRLDGMLRKQVEILMDASGQRVLDRDDGQRDLAPGHLFESLVECDAGCGPDVMPEDLVHSALAERSQLALEGHGRACWNAQSLAGAAHEDRAAATPAICS